MKGQPQSHILVVDDDSDIRDLLASLLDLEGYDVQTAPNGKVALDLVTAKRPSLVVLDLRMPIMDGWTFLDKLKERRLVLPIIVLSAEPQHSSKVVTNAKTVYVTKPFAVDDLLRVIERFRVPRRHPPPP